VVGFFFLKKKPPQEIGGGFGGSNMNQGGMQSTGSVQLINYIRQMKQRGYSPNQIRQSLIGQGYDSNQVEMYLKYP